MIKRPLYNNYLARDFTLSMMEIWWRAEVSNSKVWTDKKQSHLPYIVFENTGPIVNGYYDFRGIKLMVNLLREKIEETGNLDFIEVPSLIELEKIKSIYEKPRALNKKDFIIFLKQCEIVWTWFEALWWVWESELLDEYKDILKGQSKRLIRLRIESQDLVPGIEATICKSLEKFYPSLGDLVYLLRTEEIINDKLPSIKVLKNRKQGYFFVNNKLFVGKNRKFIEDKYNIKLEEKIDGRNIKEFKGNVAYKGIVRGVVKIVYSTRQMDKVKKGDVIVAPMTLPDILPAMKKAVAFVTDEGGIVCHAAIMAREMKKPCIIGTKIATQVLKDGMMVEVDANNGVVKVLK